MKSPTRSAIRFGWGFFFLLLNGCTGNVEEGRNEKFPTKPIQLVIPFAAGGGTDVFARIIAKAIEDDHLLPQPLVIINRGGAGATIGSRFVKDAAADGYTMLLLHNAILTAKHSRMVDYGPEAFEPVAGTGEVGMVITVRSSSEYESLGELLLAAKQNPDTITFGANLGALTHYAGLALENLYPGAAFRYIQLGGGAKRLSNLIGGHIEVTGFSIEEYIRFSSEGQLRGLAYFGPERHPRAPDVPTAREAGFDLTSSNIFYWWFPKGTSPERIEVLATALEKAMRTEYVQTKMTEIHCRPIFLKGEGLRRRIQVAAKEFASIPRPEPPDLPNFPAIILAAIVILLAVIMVDHHRSVGHREHELSTLRDETGSVPRNGLAIICVGMTVIYVLVMSEGWVSFRFATIAFVFAVGAALTRSRFLNLPVVGTLAAIALFMGLGLGYLFTQVFVIDLP